MNIIKVTYVQDIPRNFTGQVKFKTGDVLFFKNGKYHKEDGPAFFSKYRDKHWFKEGKRHRLDGPAIEWNHGKKEWYIEGREYFPCEIMDYFKQVLILEKEKGNDGLIWLKFLTDRGIEKYPIVSGMEESIAPEYLEMIK